MTEINPFAAFGSAFLSYLLVFVIFIAAACAALVIGITIAKKREAKKASEEGEAAEARDNEPPIEIG